MAKHLLLLLLVAFTLPISTIAGCKPSGFLNGKSNGRSCEECCRNGVKYPKFNCSPRVKARTKAILTVNDFSDGGDGGGASSCDERFHDGDKEKVVALSTGWFDKRSRCGKKIVISANGRSVAAKVVDECDSRNGCDEEHAFQPPCRNNIVDASVAVWHELGFSEDDPEFGEIAATWKDA